MSLFQRITAIVGAIISMMVAFALLYVTGLPDRRDFTGRQIEGLGYVAPEINAIAPPFTAQTLSGATLSLVDLRGEVVIVNFWATWCVPCRVEMPELQALYERHENIHIIGVNLGEGREAVQQWVDEFGLTFDIVFDPRGNIADDYRLRGQPSTYVINPDGIITYIAYGPVSMDTLHSAIHMP